MTLMTAIKCLYITVMQGKPRLLSGSHASYHQESSTIQPSGRTDIVLAALQTHLATANIYRVQKKGGTILLPQTLPNVEQLSKLFHQQT